MLSKLLPPLSPLGTQVLLSVVLLFSIGTCIYALLAPYMKFSVPYNMTLNQYFTKKCKNEDECVDETNIEMLSNGKYLMTIYIMMIIVAFTSLVLVNLKMTKLHSLVCLVLLVLCLAIIISLPIIVINNSSIIIDTKTNAIITKYGEFTVSSILVLTSCSITVAMVLLCNHYIHSLF